MIIQKGTKFYLKINKGDTDELIEDDSCAAMMYNSQPSDNDDGEIVLSVTVDVVKKAKASLSVIKKLEINSVTDDKDEWE